MQKPRPEAFARMLIDFNISSLSAFVSALKASFASDVAYLHGEESHTYVLKSS